MKKSIALIVLLAVVAACGSTEARSGGTLSANPAETTTTTSPQSPDTTVVAPPTTTAAGSPPTTTSPPVVSESTVTVYFLDDSPRAVPVERTVKGPAVARAAVEAVIAGPSSSEENAGLATAFPADSLVLGLTIDGAVATVDMSLEFESGGGTTSVLGRLAQLVYTLTEFETVESVRLLIEGQAVEHFSGEGVIVAEPLTRADFTEAFPIVAGGPAAAVPTWDQGDLGTVEADDTGAHTVVLVAADDFLNVRRGPGVEAQVVGRLRPEVLVEATGETTAVGASVWREILTPAGTGWVNGFYLTPSRVDESFEGASLDLITELSERFDAGAEFGELVSGKGLWVSHHAPPVRFDHEELEGILEDNTTHRWGSNALEPDSPEIRPRTFAEAVSERFVDAYDDPDREVRVGEAVEGPNGRPPEFALPSELAGFPFVTVFDPGDEPQYEGLDWTTWIVSFSTEDGTLRVVGLTLDEWAP